MMQGRRCHRLGSFGHIRGPNGGPVSAGRPGRSVVAAVIASVVASLAAIVAARAALAAVVATLAAVIVVLALVVLVGLVLSGLRAWPSAPGSPSARASRPARRSRLGLGRSRWPRASRSARPSRLPPGSRRPSGPAVWLGGRRAEDRVGAERDAGDEEDRDGAGAEGLDRSVRVHLGDSLRWLLSLGRPGGPLTSRPAGGGSFRADVRAWRVWPPVSGRSARPVGPGSQGPTRRLGSAAGPGAASPAPVRPRRSRRRRG